MPRLKDKYKHVTRVTAEVELLQVQIAVKIIAVLTKEQPLNIKAISIRLNKPKADFIKTLRQLHSSGFLAMEIAKGHKFYYIAYKLKKFIKILTKFAEQDKIYASNRDSNF